MEWLAIAASALIVVVVVTVAYRWTFLIAYLLCGRRKPDAVDSPIQHRFAVMIPAHDEELLIGDLIGSIRAAAYPQDRIAIHVIADNCTDGTAEIARGLSAMVHERNDLRERGKGQALAFGLKLLELDRYDAVAIIDADNLVDREFFRAMNRELNRGGRVLQGYDGLSNPEQTVLTRLIAVTSVMKNLLFYGGKAALGWSILLMGTGIVIRCEVLKAVGWRAKSIAEDLEQSFALRENGERIRFVPDARVYAQEAANLRQGYAQRQRWSSGRQAVWRLGWRALLRGMRTRRFDLAEMGIEVLLPTYSMTANLTLLALALSLVLAPANSWWLIATSALLGFQMLEVAAGLWVMQASWRFIGSLAFAPVFLAWKGTIDALALAGYRRHRWARTERREKH
jgi:cellulose synthase/poly-beta-1,6-N-acetylglucosamine synthase-like glycosyltransferase